MSRQRVAIITGASRGLGLALARELASRGWRLVIDARGRIDLERRAGELRKLTDVHALTGDLADSEHRRALTNAAGERIDLLVNNASILGPSPQLTLAAYPMADLEAVFQTNVLAPLELIQLALPRMRRGTVINLTSDAATTPYPGWGGYGASKAALEQLSAVLAVEAPDMRVYAVDPGDMRTRMHQQAFPGEDISDRPPPEESVPGLLFLINRSPASGRYRSRELAEVAR